MLDPHEHPEGIGWPGVLDRIGRLEDTAAALLRHDLDEAQRGTAERNAGDLTAALTAAGDTGAAGTARRIATMLADRADDPRGLAEAVVALRAAVEAGPPPHPTHRTDPRPTGVTPEPHLLVAGTDPGLTARLTTAAGSAGWSTRVVPDVGEALVAARQTAPRALLLDLPAGDPPPDLAALAAVTPTVVLGGGVSAAGRLAAVRAGAVGLVDRATPAAAVVAFLTRLTIDTSPVTLLALGPLPAFDRLREQLQAPRYRVVHVSDPTRWWEAVERTRPAVVLLAAAPPTSGVPDRSNSPGSRPPEALDLCRMIRSDPRREGTAIVVVAVPSPDPSAGPASTATFLAAGADDVVTPAVDPVELHLRLRSRVAARRTASRPRPPAPAPVRQHPTPGAAGSPEPTTGERSAREPVPPPRNPPAPSTEVAAGRTATPAAPEETDVVLVEDDDLVATVVEYALRLQGLRSHRITDGVTAAAHLAEGRLRARLVLLDVGLPGLDGFGVLGRLREAGFLADTPVIMLTARSGETETLAALDLGATDYLAKPFSVPILLSRITRALGQGS